MFGLSTKDIACIIEVLTRFEEISMVKIFGSRALGNYKKGSDIDIAIFGENANDATRAQLHDILNEEIPLPYFFDVILYNEINNHALKSHIDTVGKILYQK